ncbi:IclR family transcriptional regulator [Candidatus Bipolaricaulota bacterium]
MVDIMTTNRSESNGQTVRVVDKAFSALLVLSKADRDMDLAGLAKQTGLPKSTLVRLLHTMKLSNIVQQDPRTRRYRLGWGLIHLGKAAEHQVDLERIVRPYLEQLANETNETASFATLEGTRAVYLAQVVTDRIIRGVPPIGAELPLHSTAVGKVLLTSFSEEQIEKLAAEHGLTRTTERTIDNTEQLRREIEVVSEQGYALDNEEAERGGRCIAAPIHDDAGNVIAGLSITGPTSRIQLDRVGEFAEIVKRVAARVGEALRAP